MFLCHTECFISAEMDIEYLIFILVDTTLYTFMQNYINMFFCHRKQKITVTMNMEHLS